MAQLQKMRQSKLLYPSQSLSIYPGLWIANRKYRLKCKIVCRGESFYFKERKELTSKSNGSCSRPLCSPLLNVALQSDSAALPPPRRRSTKKLLAASAAADDPA
jgi:hypothetical protein